MYVKMWEEFLWPDAFDTSYDAFGFTSKESKKIVIRLDFLKDDGDVPEAK
jgi:hypothetical protein